MNQKVHRACVYSGFVCVALFLLGFVAIAQLTPPPQPGSSAQVIAEFYRNHVYRIRIGLVLSTFASVLLAPWVAAVSIHMRRIEGKHPMLAYCQLGLGMLLVFELVYCIFFWQVGTFRLERSDESILLLNDLGWIPWDGLTELGVVDALVIGVAILADKGARPVFPRWAGYLNLWIALLYLGGSLNMFFKDGPLAWNGIIAWYIPLGAFCVWIGVMSWLMLQNPIPADDTETAPESASSGEMERLEERLEAQLATMRSEIAQFAARN